MKFKLTPLAPMVYTYAIIQINPATGLRQRYLETFEKDVVYDTVDYESRYPVFTKDILELKLQESGVTQTQIAEARAIYGQDLKVEDCGCSSKSANMLFPLFWEVTV